MQDSIENITPGSILHMGENVLAVVKTLIHQPNSDNIKNKENSNKDSKNILDQPSLSDDTVIYFDLFGMSLVNYSMTTGLILHLGLAILVGVLALHNNFFLKTKSILYMSISPILMATATVALSALAAIVLPILVALILSKVNCFLQ